MRWWMKYQPQVSIANGFFQTTSIHHCEIFSISISIDLIYRSKKKRKKKKNY